jgi:hypothetical protein
MPAKQDDALRPVPMNCAFGVWLEEVAELLDPEPSITYKTAHRECVDRIVTRNG